MSTEIEKRCADCGKLLPADYKRSECRHCEKCADLDCIRRHGEAQAMKEQAEQLKEEASAGSRVEDLSKLKTGQTVIASYPDQRVLKMTVKAPYGRHEGRFAFETGVLCLVHARVSRAPYDILLTERDVTEGHVYLAQ
ncbi:hypothetical protein ADL22_12750 [Streptomyces sp. NRRL F-4489]|uniref:hypothetical protein n=1 Tax=Streptomyces sp. NRRL F-4489 TaxID=1609095 RepID=UPI000747F953|nr:hypothetical protein [Streptomyces sp. NRRL F-4489]KUL44806.1 hypothetical protein ADL22_12750 [Streptomyces sp. NRRL F-4489]